MYTINSFAHDSVPKKFLTFSYDDSVLQDRRLISLFRKYNLKGTFNLNSGLFGTVAYLPTPIEGKLVDHSKVFPDEVHDLYSGQEVAAHSLHHPKLWDLTDEELIKEIGEDALNIKNLSGQEVIGMAYPGGPFFDDRVIRVIIENTTVFYSRDVKSTYGFEMPDNLMIWHPTIYHLDDRLFELGEEFINLKPDKDSLFYIWGHSYEFDMFDAWDKIEEFFKMISNREDIIYATNGEIALYTRENKNN